MARIAAVLVPALLACAQLAAQAPPRLTVEQAVAEALANNLSLLAERVNIDIAEARVLTARLRQNPVFSAGGDHLDIVGNRFTEDNGGGPAELNFRTDYLLERRQKRRLRVETAQVARSVAELQFRNAVRLHALEVRNAFVDAALARDSLELAAKNLASLNRIVEINTTRHRAGDIARVELVRSQLAALQFRSTVRQGEMKLRAALIRVAALTGRKDTSTLTGLEGDLRREPVLPELKELVSQAMQLRPDLLAQRREAARAESEIGLQIAEAKPDPTIGTEYRRQQGVNGKSNSLGFFVEIPLPLFNRNQGEIERARRENRQAELRARALELAIAAEVETAWRQSVTAAELLRDIETSMLQQATDVRNITEYSYQRGDATLLEFLDAQRAFNETMLGHYEARAEHARSLYLLDAVSGKGVQP